jgi:Uncharacterized protein conserved in bacteria
MPSFRRPFAAVAGLLLTAALAAHPLPQRNAQGLLCSPVGQTLYAYDPDGSGGGSQCSGPCAAVWPPYTADAGATAPTDFSTVKRDDGSLQWAYRGRPLYLFAGDAQPGDHDGDGVNGQWHVVH